MDLAIMLNGGVQNGGVVDMNESPASWLNEGLNQEVLNFVPLQLDNFGDLFQTADLDGLNASFGPSGPEMIEDASYSFQPAQNGVSDWAHQLPNIDPQLHTSDNLSSEDSDDSDDVQMVDHHENTHGGGSRHDDDEIAPEGQVCYGMIHQADVKLIGDMAVMNAELANRQESTGSEIQKFVLETTNQNHILLRFPSRTQFGYLRDNMTKAFDPLLRQSDLRLEAVAPKQRLQERISRSDRSADAMVHVNINIYGPQSQAAKIGDDLTVHKLWLQKPDYYKTQYPYENPHVIQFPEFQGTLEMDHARTDVVASKPRAAEDRLQQMVSEVHGSLQRANETSRLAGDRRLITNLLEHQQRALAFMSQRETGSIDEKYLLWQKSSAGGAEMYTHRITKTRSQVRPEEKGGGILADEMGMGKSLSLLALLLETLEDGHAWAEKKQSEEHLSTKIQKYTHSTLVVVPSALLINNWLNEIKIHTGNTLKVMKYHGAGRKQDIDVILSSDIVITTYNTLAVEFASKNGKKSLLHTIGWHRVVLDEAHIIRRPSTTFHRTCVDLEAKSRWCLTGTPIQNRLDDIGALFMFLRAEPFHSLAQFRRFISVPFEQAESVAKDRLIMLYDSLCLRRTKDILELPGHDERQRRLELTQEERDKYIRTQNIVNRYMRQQVGEHEKQSKFGLFQAHLQLRILCNHGTYQRLFSWKKRSANDEREALMSELGMNAEVVCDGCRQPRPVIGTNRAQKSFIENCPHTLCAECMDDAVGSLGDNGPKHCPLCQTFGIALPDIGSIDGGGDTVMGEEGNHEEKHAKLYFNDTGYSSKMEALMKDVMEDLQSTKSIIFSCWTRTLDLVARHLGRDEIRFLRIDGEILLSQRQRILDKFARSKKYRVLIMTTGTGAFGLNLTAANRVFIVEPQWNPSVENQAIARAIRLRQEEKVIVTRYVIRDTVEESMQSQQVKKRIVASFGFEGGRVGEEQVDNGAISNSE